MLVYYELYNTIETLYCQSIHLEGIYYNNMKKNIRDIPNK